MNNKLAKSLLPGIAFLTASLALHATITIIDTDYSVSSHYSDPSSNNIVSYDWDTNDNLFYQTGTSSYGFGGFYKYDYSTLTTLTLPSGSYTDFPGASVVAVGDFVYFNSSDYNNTQAIYLYDGASSVTLVSTEDNYGLYAHGGDLFVTGAAGFGTNHIFWHPVNPSTGALGTREDLGETSGASGPIAFDDDGNLYYAPGYGDLSIYKWSAVEVLAAIADPGTDPLEADGAHLWVDYSTDYPTAAGGTSMIIDQDGNLLLTLTDFGNPSALVKFEVDGNGDYSGNTIILEDDDRLGELRLYEGTLYLSSADTIYELTYTP
ncbi:hypothetical protein OpiT1DRAFT_00288 [Opitutaceae bacterium TAV1]|nr:hypothetical protein OpiT1DRAFT_00288 [Opitutaceae bacterium TAV1]